MTPAALVRRGGTALSRHPSPVRRGGPFRYIHEKHWQWPKQGQSEKTI